MGQAGEGQGRGWLGSLRWRLWLAAAACAAVFHLAGPWLVVNLVIAPSADKGRQGWLVERFNDQNLMPPALARLLVPGQARVEINEPHQSLRAMGLWRVERGGEHELSLTCDDYGTLYLDGKPLIQLSGISDANQGRVKVSLSDGPHLLRVDLHNGPGRGFFSLLAVGPGGEGPGFLAGPDLVYPDLGNLDLWVKVLEQARRPLPSLLGLGLMGALALLLPLAARPSWLGLGLTCLLVLMPSALMPGPPAKDAFGGRPIIAELRALQPDYVFIGNSMVDHCIDPERLERLTGGRVKLLVQGGTRSALHYLMFKNLLIASGIKPKATFIFFRDNYLTNPLLRTRGPKAERLFALYSSGPDPIFDAIVSRRGHVEQTLLAMTRLALPMAGHAQEAGSPVSDLALKLALPQDPGGKTMKARGRLKEEVNERLGLKHLRAQADEADPVHDRDLYLDFDKVVEGSFVPHFIRLAREQGLNLIFVRVQRRPRPDGPPLQSEALLVYMDDLRRYFQRQGVAFHDFTGDPEAPLSMYGAGDHIALENSARFTEIFHQRLRGVFP